MAARRIQLRRTRGWRMPPNTVKVDRTTAWGNPFRLGARVKHPVTGRRVVVESSVQSVALFRAYLRTRKGSQLARKARLLLAGKNLACWCPPGQPCHGDVLLTLANRAPRAKSNSRR